MAEINVSQTDVSGIYDVEVRQDGEATQHQVTVPEDLQRAGLPEADHEQLLRASFEFLLERERPSAILPRFSLPDIGRYFPEYPEELQRRLG